MGPEITALKYCYVEMAQEAESGERTAPFRTSLNICYWDHPFQDCSHQQLPHHPQCECPACDQIPWDMNPTPDALSPLEIATWRIAPWDQRIMKLAGPLIPCVGAHHPMVTWNEIIANQALDKYSNHYHLWQASNEWKLCKAISMSDSNLAMGGPDSRSGKLPGPLYEAFLPRESASTYAELAAMMHAQVNTIVTVVPHRAPPYARHTSPLHKLKWGWGSNSLPTGVAADKIIDWGPPLHHQNGEWELANTGRLLTNSRATVQAIMRSRPMMTMQAQEEEAVNTNQVQPSPPTNHDSWGMDHDPPLGQPWPETNPSAAPSQNQPAHVSGWGGSHPAPLHQWGATPTPSVATDDQASGSLSLSLLARGAPFVDDHQASGSLSLSLLARGEPFVDEDQEDKTTNKVSLTATDGICIFAEWATTLPKREFVKMHARLTQAQKDPIMSKQSTQDAFTFRLAIQQVTPFTAWFRATKDASKAKRENHRRLVFEDAKEKMKVLRTMLTQQDLALGEVLHHVADTIRNVNIPGISVELAAEAAIRKMTWRLPFVFDETFENRISILNSKTLALEIYYQQKHTNAVHANECVNLFNDEREALTALCSHVQQRRTVADPTLATTEQNVLSLLIGEMEELEMALHHGHTHNVVDEMGDVLYMASHANPDGQDQQLPTINHQQLANVFAGTQSTMNLIHCMGTWRISAIETASFKQYESKWYTHR